MVLVVFVLALSLHLATPASSAALGENCSVAKGLRGGPALGMRPVDKGTDTRGFERPGETFYYRLYMYAAEELRVNVQGRPLWDMRLIAFGTLANCTNAITMDECTYPMPAGPADEQGALPTQTHVAWQLEAKSVEPGWYYFAVTADTSGGIYDMAWYIYPAAF